MSGTYKIKVRGGRDIEVVTVSPRRTFNRVEEKAKFSAIKETRFASLEELRERRLGKPREN
jgi:hypothetical protein